MNIELLENVCTGYRLLDSGNRRKLEQFGNVRIVRSEPKAWWKPTLPDAEWRAAVAVHEDDGPREGSWRFRGGRAPEPWTLKFRDAFALQLRFMDRSMQIGVFPEQSPHWDFVLNNPVPAGAPPRRLLNLFGYTGAASLAAARARADTSRTWTRRSPPSRGGGAIRRSPGSRTRRSAGFSRTR